MVDDPNRKTPRQFSCRDHLWDAFEQLSHELECSVDYLINEAMRHYLRAQGRTAGARDASTPGLDSSAMQRAPAAAARPPTMPTPPPMGGRPPVPALPPAAPQRPQPAMPVIATALPPMPGARAPASLPSIPPRAPAPLARPTPPLPAAPPAAPQRPPAPAIPALPTQRGLYVICAGEQLPVAKEEFWIGRGQKLCDLVIRDTNISRQHARVVLHGGQYWIVDNGSTNGIEFRGAKIQQKRIDEGDVFQICGHDLQFVYR